MKLIHRLSSSLLAALLVLVGLTVARAAEASPLRAVAGPASAGPVADAGYWLVGADGGVFAFGDAVSAGSLGMAPAGPIVGMAATPSGAGYWLVGSDGGVFAFGDAAFHGSIGGKPLTRPIVGMAATRSGDGYWLVGSDGGIFSFGDAAFHGSAGSLVLNQPIVGMAATRSGAGYWLVASDGGIFSFGDAAFYGSTGAVALNQPVVGMSATSSGDGYWLVASDGGIFTFGDAAFYGSTGATLLHQPIVGIAVSDSGYWLVASDGGIFSFGDAAFDGSMGNTTLVKPIVAMSKARGGRGPAVTGISPRSGPVTGGTLVTITGTGFGGTTGVGFGSRPATTVIVLSATEVTAISPAGSGTVDVSVTTPRGTSLPSSADSFAYGAVPGAPGNVYVIDGFCSLVVTFGPLSNIGSSPVTSYTATASPGSYKFTGQATSLPLGGGLSMHLDEVPDGTYSVTVHATNAAGDGPESPASLMTGSSTNCPPPPAPTVTSVSPSTGLHGGGTTVTVTGSGFTGITNVVFGGNFATSFTVINDGMLTATSPAGAGTVDVMVPGLGGQSVLSLADKFTYEPDGNVPDPPTNVSAAIDCATAAVFFTPPAGNGTGPIIEYTATSNGGQIGVLDSPFIGPITVRGLNPIVPYTFTVHAANALGSSVESAPSGSATATRCVS